MNILVGGTNTLKVTGKTLRGFYCFLYLIASATNTAIATSDLDMSKIITKVTLNRGGVDSTLLSSNMQIVALDSAFYDSSYLRLYTTYCVQVAAAIGVTAISLVPAYIDFQSPINLRGEDSLSCEIQFNSGAVTTVIGATSYIELKPMETIGYEFYTPQIKVQSIQAGQENIDLSLGNNVTAVSFINTDKTNVLAATAVISSGKIDNDKYNQSFDYIQLLTQRFNTMPEVTMADNHAQSFRLLDSAVGCNEVTLNLLLVTANVNTGKNYIVTRCGYSSKGLLELASTSQQIHNIRNANRIGLGAGYGAELNRLQQMKSALIS